MSSEKLIHLNFEVFGKVQGVYFRKNTQAKAKELGIRGWIRNTEQKTVKGELQGEVGNIRKMKVWLEKEGSPKSRIDQAIFKNEKEIKMHSFNDFSIKK